MPKASIRETDDDVLRALQERTFNPRESVVMTRREYERVQDDFFTGEESVPLHSFEGSAKILKYTLNRVEIETECNDASFLVLADNYYPGWKVYVNGKERNVLRVDYNLRGVILGKGGNKVQFSFEPLSFRVGASVSLFSLIGSGAFFLMARRVKHKGKLQP